MRIPGPWNRSLRARLVGYFLLLSGVTVAVVGVVVYARATDDLTRSVFERLNAVAEVKADSLDRWIDEQRRNVVFVGSIPGVGDEARVLMADQSTVPEREAAAAALRKMLGVVVAQTADAQEFMILDLAGTVRLSTLGTHDGESQADEFFFTNGISHTTVQNAYTSSLTNLPTITISNPLFDADGKGRRVGVVAGNLNLERIDRIVLERTGLGEGGATYLVGADHRFVHARLNQGDYASGVGSAGIDEALSGTSGQALYADYRGVPVIGVYRWLEEHDAALLVELPQAEAFAPAQGLALTIAIVGLFSALFLALGIWLIARQVTRPILAPATTATAVAGGDLTATVPVTSEDEVGQLTGAFNDMTVQLRENVATLERRVDERTAELTEAMQAQAEAERRYRRLVDELPLAVYMDSPDDPLGASLYVSPPIEAMFGYPAVRWLEPGFFESIVHPDDSAGIEAGQIGQHRAADRATFEYRIVAADGRPVWIRDDNTLIRTEDGTPEYVLGFFLDVTAQHDAADEIRRQKLYFESLVEISPAAVVTMDRDERVTAWNPAAERLFGYAPDAAIGRRIDELIMAGDEMRAEGHGVAREALATGRATRISRRARHDGGVVDVEIVMVPLVIDGEHTGFYAVYHDITELQAARQEADAANQAKGSFLAAMSHEIRTPMNAIIGMSGLLLETPVSDEQRDYAETIRTSGDALLTIINDILDFSKIEAGRIDLEAEPFDLRRAIEGALDVLAPATANKGIELAYEVHESVPQRLVGDVGRFRQIVLNLLSNAVKFTESGEVVLTATGRLLRTAGHDGEERWEISIEVRDTGIGIPPDRIGRLFQSFSQADASISRRFGGTGLGLIISRRLAEAMGGSLTAESSGVSGEGSTFLLRILVPEAIGSAEAPNRDEPEGLAGRRALIVDDNATNRRILVAQLARWGVEARETGAPAEALEWLRGGARFDVVLSDLRMPDMDGLALAGEIRSVTGPARIPVVILSSIGERMPADAPIAGSLSKPIKPSPLHDALVNVLAGGVAASPPRGPEQAALDPGLAARHPLRILLAEDNRVNQKLALRLLERMGYSADVVGDGLRAIAALEESDYDVVLMDVQMPELDGLEATRQIRGRWPGRGLRIVAMTANAMAEDREACLDAGMDDYVSKPIRVEELVAALERATPA
ncbi:MAG: response regulator [Chloroflexota bacterium]|nr:response regulator [Chloroflexota bacterium]